MPAVKTVHFSRGKQLALRNEGMMPAMGIRVLVVDDSPLMRRVIGDSVDAAANMELAGTAANGEEAIAKVRELKPDVVTLDIQMPGMDGLTALDQILAIRPIPVIMVSSLTRRAADVTLNALDRGAIDYVAKPENAAQAQSVLGDELIRKIRAAYGADVVRVIQIRKRRRPIRPVGEGQKIATAAPKYSAQEDVGGLCIAIGISTGGPPALTRLFETLAPPMPPIVVVQHMPAQFTGPFAKRLDCVSDLSIKEAERGDVLEVNNVYVAPGGLHLYLQQRGRIVKVDLRDEEPVSSHKPSVDVMMNCAARIYGNRCLGVVMTGMGRDGSDGCRAIKESGGYVLGQDQHSSDVYGMNKVAFTEGHVHEQFSLDDAAAVLTSSLSKLRAAAPA
jgi:two-component system, chemotaxis family, protein-glutamate methylesterase/glutaminase